MNFTLVEHRIGARSEKSMFLTDSGISTATAWPSTTRIMSSESLSLEIYQNKAGFVKRNASERSASCILIRCKWNRYRVVAAMESLIERHLQSSMELCFKSHDNLFRIIYRFGYLLVLDEIQFNYNVLFANFIR